jgi:predicted DNA-binding transcriptional regulator AlpA
MSDVREVAAAVDPLRTRGELCEQAHLSTRTLARLELEGKGPPRIQLTDWLVRYRQSDIDAWLAARTQTGARPTGAAPTAAIETRRKRRAAR